MTTVRIVLAEALPAFRPGEVLEGRVEWEASESTEPLDLRLSWTTEGSTGSEEPEIVRAERVEVATAQGNQPFRLELPDGPWSFDGKLFSIQWKLEVSLHDEPLARAGFILSPTGQALRPRG